MNKILKIKDIMSVDVVSFSVDTLVDEIVSTMQEQKISSVIIVEGKKPLGIITERDILKASLSPDKILKMDVTKLMSSPVKVMPSHSDYRDAYMQMNEQKIRHIVVTDKDGELVGILSESSFLNHLSPEQLLAVKEISKVMTKTVLTCKPNDTLRSVLEQMVDRKIGGIVVEENNKAIGIISERDALKFIKGSKELLDQVVSTCMSSPVTTIHKNQTVLNAQSLMEDLHIRRLVVVDDDEVIAGIVSRHDLIKHIPEYYVEILREMIDRQQRLVSSTQVELDEKVIFQNAVKSLPHTLVLMTQKEGIIQFVNINEKAFCSIPTIKVGDNLDNQESSFFEIIQNDTWKDTVVNGETVHKIIKIKNKNADSCYLHTSISAIFDEKNRFNGYLYIARNISLEHTLELELKRLTDHLKEAYHIANIGNWELDAKTLNGFWSDEICDIVGMPRNSQGGPEVLKTLVKEEDFEIIENSLLSALQTGSSHELIYEVFPKNSDKSHWVECRARRELNEDGSPKCLIGTLQDITQRVEAQRKARENEDSMVLALESAGHGVWDLNVKDNTQYLSPQYKSMLGYENDEMENTLEAFLDLLHPDDLSQVQSTIESFITNKHSKGNKFSHIFRMKAKNGTYKWILSNGNVVSVEDNGNILRVIGTHTDISEQKQVEEKIKESESKFKGVFEQAAVGAARVSLDGTWFEVNKKLCDIVGYSKEELLTKTFQDITHPDDLEADLSYIHQLLNREIDTYSMNKRYFKKDKSIVWINLTASLVRKIDNSPDYFVSIIEDITQKKKAEEALAKEKIRYEKAEKIAHLGSWEQNFDDGTLQWSDEVYRIFEIDISKEMTFDDFAQRIHPEDRESVFEAFQSSVKEHNAYHITHRLLFSDGRVKYVLEDAQHFYDSSDNHISTIGTAQDITTLKENEHKLRQSATVFENTTEGVMITDANSIILNVNKAFYQITGREHDEVLGKKASILKSGRHNKKFYNEMWKNISELGSWRGEIWNRRKDGEIYPQWLNISSVKNNSGVVESYIAVFSDITSLKETEAQLDFLAHHDHLTELPNRVLLNARLKHTLSTAKRDQSMTAVMFMDIDNFKNINDSYGHTFGDELLIALSKRLDILIREDDTFSRIGGDEFVIVMSHFKSLDQITHISQKIMEQFEKVFVLEEKEFWVSVSIGISIAPHDGNSSEILIKNADTAMYEAKGDGKNTVKFYDDKMSASSFERVVFESALKAGINNKEFEVYYQPQEDLQDNSIIGFEALVRWNHPSLGLVPPDRFISIAEETKMILDIGEFVLKQSCKDIKKWHDEGLCKGRVAVNVSGIQLEHSEFAEILKTNLKKYNVDPSMIEIEVTESMVMKNPERWISILEEIHRVGVSISIDDFGTGYSSLSYLRRLPVDTLKIDQSFIQDIPQEKDACAIVDAIINMADSLGLNTLAEGIETSDQREYLVNKSCKHGQGYLLSKPMSAKDAYNWLKEKSHAQ